MQMYVGMGLEVVRRSWLIITVWCVTAEEKVAVIGTSSR